MHVFYAIALTFLTVSGAMSAEGTKWRPLPEHMRVEFDRVMTKMWHQDCQCWRFLFENKIYEYTPAEMDDDLRWSILKLIEIGEMIPIKNGPPS